MDVRGQARERVFSILIDNDCPSFQIPCRRRRTTSSPQHDRPCLQRQTQFRRTSSVSSTVSSSVSASCSAASCCNSPPLHRLDSAGVSSSGESMDSPPSPATPAYGYHDIPLAPYDTLIRQDTVPVSANVSPFLEQPIMLGPPLSMPQPVQVKHIDALPAIQQYSILPALAPPDSAPPPSFAPSTTAASATSPVSKPPLGKKNKYPCPYAQSHNCTATFTTSGHAARHGKKHTGEKGVHCPVCNKAFTRKDNMKQHERTHKVSISSSVSADDSNARRSSSSKALVTREAQKTRATQQDAATTSESVSPFALSQQSSTRVKAIAEQSVGYADPTLYPDPVNHTLLQTVPLPSSVYPPLADDSLQPAKAPKLANNMLTSMPPLVRGFSDLDALAHAAENFDPYYQPAL